MPFLTRLFIKTSLVYLLLALLASWLLSAQTAGFIPAGLPGLFPVTVHLFVLGWVTQLIFGVVYWMFPKYTREKPRGSSFLAWLTYASLNLGLALRTVGEPLHAARPVPLSGWLLAGAALLLWLSGAAFIANTWRRVRER